MKLGFFCKKIIKKFILAGMCLLIFLLVMNHLSTSKENGKLSAVDKVYFIRSDSSNLTKSLHESTYTEMGETYNNYITYEGVSVSSSSAVMSDDFAVDGSKKTYWQSERDSDDQYFQVYLGNSYEIEKLGIFWESESASEYEIQISNDGINYVSIGSVKSDIGERTDNVSLEAVRAAFIRIKGKGRNTGEGYGIYEIGVFGHEAAKEAVEEPETVYHLSNLKIENYYKYTGKIGLYFTEETYAKEYRVYVDDKKVAVLEKSGQFLEANELEDIENGEHTLTVKSVINNREFNSVSGKFEIESQAGKYTDVPQMYIYTSEIITKKYHTKSNVSICLVDENGGTYETILDNECNIKIRGNSTANANKKPWNIKFSRKTEVLGMSEGKKWALLANQFDKSLMRNKIVYDFGKEIGLDYTPDSRYVEVYLNGLYMGNYLMTETVEVKKNRVDIDAYNPDSTDILIELGTRNESDVMNFTTSRYNLTFDVNDPETGDELSDDQIKAKIKKVKEFLGKFEDALHDRDYDQVIKYMDEESFVNFYITCEYFKNVDVAFSSTRFYIKDNKLYAGPLWDFDLSSGNPRRGFYWDYYNSTSYVSYEGLYATKMTWFNRLVLMDDFMSAVKDRYEELQDTIQNIYKKGSKADNSIDQITKKYGASFARNYLTTYKNGAGWTLDNSEDDSDNLSIAPESKWENWKEPVKQLRTWLKKRNEYLCNLYGINTKKENK